MYYIVKPSLSLLVSTYQINCMIEYSERTQRHDEPLGAEAPPLVGGGGARREGGVGIPWVHDIS